MLEKFRKRLGLDRSNARSDSAAAGRVAAARWYHAFELLPGLVTPGSVAFDAASLLNSVGIEEDLHGKRAIDIGAWDGPMTFELERRGAKVVALDLLDPDETAFNLAKELLGSKVEYVRGSVYDLSELFKENFDLVCFLGVYYHLKNPIQAFEEIAKVLAEGGRVFLEGECLRRYAEDLDGNGITDPFIAQVADSPVPLALCCPGEYKNSPNWFIPNFAALLSWLRVARLELVKHYFEESPGPRPHQRIKGLAVKRVPSLAIVAVRQTGRTIAVSGRGFSQRTVINLFVELRGEKLNFGGLTPDGAERLPITLLSSDELRFELPSVLESGLLSIEACNPPYAGDERVSCRFEIKG